MMLKEKIIKTLQETHVPNIDKMLQFMEQYGYFKCRSHSHNNWEGGASQHMWAVYLIAKALRDQRLKEPAIAQYATDHKLAIVCLLHDLCDMSVPEYDNRRHKDGYHGAKSLWIMEKLQVGTKAEQMAVRNHMDSSQPWANGTPDEMEEYKALHSLVSDADHKASGTAWNSTRFKQGRTQHHGSYTEDASYLRAVAMDRTIQSCNYNLYIDKDYQLRVFKNFNRDHIKPVICDDIAHLKDEAAHLIPLDASMDAITTAHDYARKIDKRICLVVDANSDLPDDNDTRLRRKNKNEQDILICSNILNAFYKNRRSEEEGKKGRYRYEFTMLDEVKQIYRGCKKHKDSGLYLPDALMIRDGKSLGFPFVDPWTADILLVLDSRFDTFVVSSERLGL